MTIHRLLLPAALLVLTVGCGQSGNPNLPASLSGSVKYKGSPVTAGTLTFYSKDGNSVGGTSLNSDGTYTATDLPAGDLKVSVETESMNPEKKKNPAYVGKKTGPMAGSSHAPKGGMQMSPMPEGATKGGGTYTKIPDKYADKDKSGLSVSLSKGSNKKDFDLTD